MNKRHGMIATALIALLLVTGCSTFFQGGVSGTVTCNGKAVGGATVAVYFDKEVWEEDYRLNVDKVKPVFNTDYKTVRTAQDGSFAITNIPWDSAFPEYGKDADSIEAYVLIHHKDYGLEKYEETLHIISGRSNEINPKFSEKLTKTADVSILFRNPETNRLENGVKSVRISYDNRPGYDKTYSDTFVANGGRIDLTIEYQGNTVPEISISEIKYSMYDATQPYAVVVGDTIGSDADGNKLYAPVDRDEVIKITPDSENNIVINTIPMVHEFSGYDGFINPGADRASVIKVYDGDKVVSSTRIEKVFTEDLKYTSFRGLGNGIKIKNKEAEVSGTSEVKGYPAIITNKDYEVVTTIDGDVKKPLTLTSDPDLAKVIEVKVGPLAP